MKRRTAGVAMLAVLSIATLGAVGCTPKTQVEAETPQPNEGLTAPLADEAEPADEAGPEEAADTAAPPAPASPPEGTQGPGDGKGGGRRDPFERFDANEDGKLTKAELPEKAAKALMAADANGDEAITRDEFQKGREDGTLRPPEGTSPDEGSGPAE